MIKKLLPLIPYGVIVVLLMFVIHNPKPISITPPVKILHDTVEVLDTVYLKKVVTKPVKPDTVWVTKEIVSKPETVTVVPPLVGLQGFMNPSTVGDTGVAFGFGVRPLQDGHYGIEHWETQWVSPGPLASLLLDSTGVKLGFYPQPLPPCSFWDNRKHEVYGAGIALLLKALLGK